MHLREPNAQILVQNWPRIWTGHLGKIEFQTRNSVALI